MKDNKETYLARGASRAPCVICGKNTHYRNRDTGEPACSFSCEASSNAKREEDAPKQESDVNDDDERETDSDSSA